MGFKCGLVGLPNAGKSTVFNAITNLNVEASAYPFCTIKPHFGIVPLEDARLDRIHEIAGSVKKTETVLEFVDIAGLVRGANHGEGLGNQFLSHIGQVDAIAQVVRCFEDDNVSHPYETMDPQRDAKIITTELILKDLELVERQISKAGHAAKTGDREAQKMMEGLVALQKALSEGKEIRTLTLSDDQQNIVRQNNLLTAKPVIFIANVDENHLENSPLTQQLMDHAKSVGAPCISFAGKIQAEIAELDQSDQLEFLKAMNLNETGLQKMVRAGYEVLNLITFFTANENEARAWTVPGGTSVVTAAGQVHTDFMDKFIKAEVIRFKDLDKLGSIKSLHEKGLAAIHGRDYIVEDGDLIFYYIRQ